MSGSAGKAVLAPFLMFEGGVAADAIALYRQAFADVQELEREPWTGQPGVAGHIKLARLRIFGTELRISDTAIAHGFTFTPSLSLFVDVPDEAALRQAIDVLGQGGAMLMSPGNYGFSRRFCWLNDRFGVSWQLNLP